jgi:hypothetical protein
MQTVVNIRIWTSDYNSDKIILSLENLAAG